MDTKEKFRVVVADASENAREILLNRLHKQHWVEIVGAASSANELCRIVERDKPDLVITDLVLDGDSGLIAMKRIAEMKRYPGNGISPTIVATSSFLNEWTLNETIECGAAMFVHKPFDTGNLMEQLKIIMYDGRPRPYIKIVSGRKVFVVRHGISVEGIVTEALQPFGISPNTTGYQYLRTAIILAILNPDIVNAVTKELYPAVAEEYGSTPQRVERAIRHELERAWENSDIEVKQEYFGCSVKKKPTNSAFIATMADRLRIKHFRLDRAA